MANLHAIAALLLLLRSTCAVKTAFISSSNYPTRKHGGVNRDAFVQSRQLQIATVTDGISATGGGSRIGSSLGQASDDNAEAFMSYMAKSHEDKLRAVKDAEDRKNAEIQALKKQIDDVKSGGGIVSSDGPSSSASGSIDEIAAKLTAYQNFMSRYIVSAQEEKRKAIEAAEEAVSKRYEDKLSALMLGAADSKSITVVASAGPTAPDTRLEELKLEKKEVKREIKEVKAEIKAAAKVDVAPLVEEVKKDTPPPPPTPPQSDPNEHAPPEVIAADHGLRADGGVGGLTLAERVALGPDAPAGPPVNAAANGTAAPPAVEPPVTATTTATTTTTAIDSGPTPTFTDPRHRVYFERNVFVSDAARAEAQYRWGPSEEQLAADYVGKALAAGSTGVEHGALPPNRLAEMDVTAKALAPEVEEADHGLRADGGVGGPSLADRVNLGAQLLDHKGE